MLKMKEKYLGEHLITIILTASVTTQLKFIKIEITYKSVTLMLFNGQTSFDYIIKYY